jgi:hypothetical protein
LGVSVGEKGEWREGGDFIHKIRKRAHVSRFGGNKVSPTPTHARHGRLIKRPCGPATIVVRPICSPFLGVRTMIPPTVQPIPTTPVPPRLACASPRLRDFKIRHSSQWAGRAVSRVGRPVGGKECRRKCVSEEHG